MATQLTNYQCPACTGPLHFDGASGKLVCDFCGSSYDTAEIEALYAEKETAAETAAQNKQAPPPDSVWSGKRGRRAAQLFLPVLRRRADL